MGGKKKNFCFFEEKVGVMQKEHGEDPFAFPFYSMLFFFFFFNVEILLVEVYREALLDHKVQEFMVIDCIK